MLTLKLGIDLKEISELYSNFGLEDAACGVHFLFLDDEKPVGFIRFILDQNSALIDKIYYEPKTTGSYERGIIDFMKKLKEEK